MASGERHPGLGRVAGHEAFDPGFAIRADGSRMTFSFGEGTFGPEPERRRLDDIRKSLRDPGCTGPEVPYAIVMDVGRTCDRDDLVRRNLLYGAVVYAAGKLGAEPVRSQGHVHAVSASCGMSTPEVYEVWEGEAVIYLQRYAQDDPGACYAVHALPGDVVVVPPSWAHATVNARPSEPMAFGAWCVRDYGFDYQGVRAHGGMAFFPLVGEDGSLTWEHNPSYEPANLVERGARAYPELGIDPEVPIYAQYVRDRDAFDFVPRPQLARDVWEGFEP